MQCLKCGETENVGQYHFWAAWDVEVKSITNHIGPMTTIPVFHTFTYYNGLTKFFGDICNRCISKRRIYLFICGLFFVTGSVYIMYAYYWTADSSILFLLLPLLVMLVGLNRIWKAIFLYEHGSYLAMCCRRKELSAKGYKHFYHKPQEKSWDWT